MDAGTWMPGGGILSAYRAYAGKCRRPAGAFRRHSGARELANRDTRRAGAGEVAHADVIAACVLADEDRAVVVATPDGFREDLLEQRVLHLEDEAEPAPVAAGDERFFKMVGRGLGQRGGRLAAALLG